MAIFCRLPSAFYSLLEELDKENTETRKNIMKMDDLLIFTTLEKLKKTHRNVAVWTDVYAVQKN